MLTSVLPPTIFKPLTLQGKHELALAKVAKFTRLAALPDLSPGEAALAVIIKRCANRGTQTEPEGAGLRETHDNPEVQRALGLYRLFRLPLPPG
jgi:hypothetical protein